LARTTPPMMAVPTSPTTMSFFNAPEAKAGVSDVKAVCSSAQVTAGKSSAMARV
jgi:hypothetical protein